MNFKPNMRIAKGLFHVFCVTIQIISVCLLLDVVFRNVPFLSQEFFQSSENIPAIIFTTLSIILGIISLTILITRYFKQKGISTFMGGVLLYEGFLIAGIFLMVFGNR